MTLKANIYYDESTKLWYGWLTDFENIGAVAEDEIMLKIYLQNVFRLAVNNEEIHIINQAE